MKKGKYSHILDNVLNEKISNDHQLTPQILVRIQKNKGANMNKRMKVLVPTVVALVILAVVLFTVPAVAQAIQRWIGYVPGFGLVKEGSVRVIDQPVQITQNGVTLTVTEVISSSTKTVIKYNFNNIPATAMEEKDSCEFDDGRPDLVLSDGSERYLVGLGGETRDSKYSFEATYNGVPENITDMTLAIKCLSQIIPGSIQSEWRVPLSFDPQNPTLTLAPVYQVPESTDQSSISDKGVVGAITVDQIVALNDGYILSGSMSVEPNSPLSVDEMDGYLEDLSIYDAHHKKLTTTLVPDDFVIEGNYAPKNDFLWSFQIPETDFAWPITIIVNSVNGFTPDFTPVNFQVEVGSNPQPDQLLEINKDITLGGKIVHVSSIRRMVGSHGFDGYEFVFIYNPDLDFSFTLEGCEPNGGGGEGILEAGKSYTRAISCSNSVPSGTLVVTFLGHGIEKIEGPWQVIVQKPAAQ